MKKHSFTTRVFSVFLCVALLCTFAPLTTIAKMVEQVYVDGIEVEADNAADVLGDGSVSYDKYTKTLTLKGAGIFNTYDTDEGSFGIFSTGDLNVVLDGDSYIDIYGAGVKDTIAGVEAKGDLTVTGEGSLSCRVPPANDFAAGFVAGGALTVDTVIDQETMMYGPYGYSQIVVGKAAESYAFAGASIDFVLGNAPFMLQAGTAAFSTAPTLTNFEFTNCSGAFVSPDDDAFEPIYSDELLNNIETVRFLDAGLSSFPNVEIGGVKLTKDNANDVLGDGTVYFDVENWELVLDNANVTGICYDEGEDMASGIAVNEYGDFYIRLIGENVIDMRDAVDAMESKPDGTIGINNSVGEDIYLTGAGSLTVYAGDAEYYSYGMRLGDDLCTYGSADLTVYAGDAAEYSCGIYVDDMFLYGIGDCSFFGGAVEDGYESFGAYAWTIYPYGGKFEEGVDHGLRFVGDTAAFRGRSGFLPYLEVRGGDYTTLCAQTKNEDDLAAPNDETNSTESAKYVFLRSDSMANYDIYVGGVQVTSENADDVLGDGTVSFDREDTFVFNNATITDGVKMYDDQDFGAFYAECDMDLYIELIGENVIDLTEADVSAITYVCGMFSDCDLTFYGDGSLTILVPASLDETDGAAYGIFTYDDIWVYDTAAITVVLPDEEETYGFFCQDECGIASPNISLTAGTTALYVSNGIISDSEFTAKYLASTDYAGEVAENDAFIFDYSVRDACKTVKTAEGEGSTSGTFYDIYVGGKRVSSANRDDVLGDGTVSYAYDDDRCIHTLTLNNANLTSCSQLYGDTAAIYSCYGEPLYIELVGDNTITISDDVDSYVMGIYSADDIHVVGDGSLTINIESNYSGENGYTYGINADYDSEDVYLEADGEITINMTGSVYQAKGIYASSFYNRNNADVTITVSEGYGVYGVYAYYHAFLQSPANFTVSAVCGEFEGEYPYAYGVYIDENLYDSPVSGFTSIVGKTQAICISGSRNVNVLTMTAYEYADDELPVETPDWYSLSYYEKVELSRSAAYTITPILSATEAECRWWDDNKGEYVGDYEEIEIGWDVGEEEIKSVALFCDCDGEGVYTYMTEIDPEMDSTFKLDATLDSSLPGATRSWSIAAEFADGTVVFSEPFDLTFYRVSYGGEMDIEVDGPQIGRTPNYVSYVYNSYAEYYKENPTFTWYTMDGETGTEMAGDEEFMPGKQYAVVVDLAFDDEFRFNKETLNASVEAYGIMEDSRVIYDSETNTLKVGVLFAPLKETINYVGVQAEAPDLTMTPADMTAVVKGYSGYSPFAFPIVDGKLTISWTYCEGDSYDPETAVAMENDAFFEAGNTYCGEISFKVKDHFTLADDAGYMLASEDPMGPATVLTGSYDAATGIATIELPIFQPTAVVKELNMFVREPEAGRKPSDIYAFGDELVEDYIDDITMEWYELDDMGNSSGGPIGSDEEFKPGVTYGMSMHVTLAEGAFENSMIPVTLNGQVPLNAVVNDWDSAYISQAFDVAATTTELDALDFTVSAVKAGDTPADVVVTFDDTKVSFVDVYAYVYEGTDDPATDVDHYVDIASTDVFEYGKIYAIEVYYTLKSGCENSEEIALTINGEEPLLAGPDGAKQGTVVMYFALEEPALTLNADVTEFEIGDSALAAVSFNVEYSFEATNRLLVDVVNADGDDMFCQALAAGTETFSVDMSAEKYTVGTYTVFVTAYDGNNAVVSNSVDVVVKEKPTTEPTTTETEPTGTGTEPTGTGTEPTGTGTEPTGTGTEPTGTGTDTVLYGDANDDGAVNMKDVLILRKQLAGLMPIINMANADCNGDGSVNMKDVLELRKFLASLITTLGPKA